MKIQALSIIFVLLVTSGCSTIPGEITGAQVDSPTTGPIETETLTVVTPGYLDPSLAVAERVEDLLSRMTLQEKIGQMTLIEKNSLPGDDIAKYYLGGVLSGGGGYRRGYNTPEGWYDMVAKFQEQALSTRLGIPIIYGVDAVHGHNNLYGAVIFPHNIGLGATRNPALVEEIGRITAIETSVTGIKWDYAPVLAVAQDPRWGRYYESYGEDTELVSMLGTAFIQGLQGDDLSDPLSVTATAKHFVGDGGTVWGTSTTGNFMIDQGDTQVDEDTLRAVHLAPYYDAIEAGARSVMISYSSWNGEKLHGHDYLINDVLKGEMGFDGFVVSDWAGVDQVDKEYYHAVVKAINAGIDMNMVPTKTQLFIIAMETAVEVGDISMERIDDAVRRILRVKFEMGLFENPMPETPRFELVGSDEHRAVAQEAVSQSLVLLKNEKNVLPLSKDAKVFVAGWSARYIGFQLGGWSIEWQGGRLVQTKGTTIVEGIEAIGGENVIYNRHGKFKQFGQRADVGIVIIGEVPYAEGFGDDGDLRLTKSDINLIKRVGEQADKVVVILVSGRPLIITEHLDLADAWVAAWLPGTEGQGVAANLYGEHPFTGILPVTWPASIDQLSLGSTDEEPLFPFGYGLTTD